MKFTLIVLSIAFFQVSFCENTNEDETGAKLSEIRQVDECTFCTEALAEVDAILGELPTQEEIDAAFTFFCDLFPESAQEECDAIIAEYADELYAALSQGVDPTLACTELGLCPAAA